MTFLDKKLGFLICNIAGDPPRKDGNAGCTTVPKTALSYIYQFFKILKTDYFQFCSLSTKITCAFLLQENKKET